MAQSVESQCGFCQKTSTNLLKCSRCTAIAYCDANCQKKHWATHKKECGPKSQPASPSAASPNLKQTTPSPNLKQTTPSQNLKQTTPSENLKQTTPPPNLKPAQAPQPQSSIRDGLEKMTLKDIIEEAKKNNRQCSPFDQSQQNLLFLQAAKTRNLLQMKLALRVGAHPDFSFPNGQTGHNVSLIHLVTQKGDLDVLQFLLEAGAQFEATDLKWGQSPLLWAVSSGRIDVIRFMVEHIKNLDIAAPSGETALYIAAYHKNYAACELLLRKGANPLIPGPAGTPGTITEDPQIQELIESYIEKGDYTPQKSVLDEIPEENFTQTINQITSQAPAHQTQQKDTNTQSQWVKYFLIFLIVCAYIWLFSAFGSYLFSSTPGEKEL